MEFGVTGQQGSGVHTLEWSESYDATRIVRERELHCTVAIFAEPVIDQDRGGNRIVRDGMGHIKKLTAIQAPTRGPARGASLTVVPSPSMIRSLSDV